VTGNGSIKEECRLSHRIGIGSKQVKTAGGVGLQEIEDGGWIDPATASTAGRAEDFTSWAYSAGCRCGVTESGATAATAIQTKGEATHLEEIHLKKAPVCQGDWGRVESLQIRSKETKKTGIFHPFREKAIHQFTGIGCVTDS
jgi:hypothetical protein